MKLHAFDRVILGYLGLISVLTLAVAPPGWWIYLCYHAAVAGMILMLAYAHERYPGRFWTFARYWYVVPIVLGSFREIHFLVPSLHPFDDHLYDRVLAGIDAGLFGDVDAFFLGIAQPQFVDFLHLCYWSYFVYTVLPGAILYAKGELAALREYMAVILFAFYLSYLGYFAVPAIGPHHFFPERPPEIDGWVLGGPMHRILQSIEWRMPDAFPSGHTLLSLAVLVMCWRLHRPSFRWVWVPAAGCIWATMALRYHYVIDVLASAALLPGVLYAGLRFHRWTEGTRPGAGP